MALIAYLKFSCAAIPLKNENKILGSECCDIFISRGQLERLVSSSTIQVFDLLSNSFMMLEFMSNSTYKFRLNAC